MHQVWGHSLHHRWTFLLQLSAHHKCRRSWRCASCVHQGLQHRMASHDKELGSELAEQCQLGCSELVLHGHHWWWANSHIHECGTCLLVLWTNIRGLSVFMTKSTLAEQSLKSLLGTRVELQPVHFIMHSVQQGKRFHLLIWTIYYIRFGQPIWSVCTKIGGEDSKELWAAGVFLAAWEWAARNQYWNYCAADVGRIGLKERSGGETGIWCNFDAGFVVSPWLLSCWQLFTHS